MFYLGIDPDTSRTAMAFIECATGRLEAVYLVKQPKEVKERSVGMACRVADALIRPYLLNPDVPDGKLTHEFIRLPDPSNFPTLACAVEGQEIYRGMSKTRSPEDILKLGPISGAAISCLHLLWPATEIYMPQPKQWKGQVPKRAHQARILQACGMEYATAGGANGYCFPTKGHENVVGAADINQGDWKHVVDAIGLAMYARQRHSLGLHKSTLKMNITSAFRKPREGKN